MVAIPAIPAVGIGVRPESFGALGNGVANDSPAIQAAINAAGAYGIVQFTPDKTYRLASTVNVLFDGQTWLCHSANFLANFPGVAIRIGKLNPTNGTDKIWHFRGFGGRVTRTTDWTPGNTAIQFVNTNMSGWEHFTIRGFHKGVELLGDGGATNVFIGQQYGLFTPDEIGYCFYPIAIIARNNGWANASTWRGGRVGYYSDGPNASDAYAIYMDLEATSAQVINQHQFYGLCLEDAMSSNKPAGSINLNCWQCVFDGLRYEGFNSPHINANHPLSAYNQFRGGSQLGDPNTAVSYPAGPRAGCFLGDNGNLLAGDGTNVPILRLQECVSGNNSAFMVSDQLKVDRFRLKGNGWWSSKVSTLWGQDVGPVYTGSKEHDFGNLANGASASTTVTTTGPGGLLGFADVGDWAIATLSSYQAGVQLTANVTALNTVTVTITNNSGGALDLASGTLKVMVQKATVG